MKTRVDRRLLDEAERFQLRFACESCCYFAPAEDTRCCALGYPNAEHLEQQRDVGSELVFCKEFELA
ncbi:MAG: hypothetical protein H6718_31885 [Polyangiaceae bacterium]|nr:hypothetical protein [Polyangiaceae bacterium]